MEHGLPEPAHIAPVPPPPQSNPTATTFASAPSTDPAAAQLDALIDAVASLGQLFSTALPQLTGAPPQHAAASAVRSAPPSSVCAFCCETGHFARECEAVTEYATAGQCKCNAEGKIVLPSGAMVPRWITGACLRDRMDEWHRRSPGQEAATSLFLSLAPGPGVIHLPELLRSSNSLQNTSSRRSGAAHHRTGPRSAPPITQPTPTSPLPLPSKLQAHTRSAYILWTQIRPRFFLKQLQRHPRTRAKMQARHS